MRRLLPLALIAVVLPGVVAASSATSAGTITAKQAAQATITLDAVLTAAGWRHGGANLPLSRSKVVSGTRNNHGGPANMHAGYMRLWRR